MSFQKQVELFKTTVDPEKATVVSFTDFVAVFGGAFRKKPSASKPKSKRDAFVQHVWKNRADLAPLLLFPEEYEDWKDFDTYSDLLLFEKDLGYLTSVVLVFLEGPGAIAEFSAFSQIRPLRERLLVVISDVHNEAKSFIQLGPIRSVVNTHNNATALCVIPEGGAEKLLDHIDVVLNSLDEKRRRQFKTSTLAITDDQHQLLLVLDLINLFLTIQISEIQELCAHMGFEPPTSRFRQILFVLEQVGLIGANTYGKTTYYVPGRFPNDYISYTSGAINPTNQRVIPFKRSNFKARLQKEIMNDAFRRRGGEQASKKVRGRTT